MHLLSCSLLFSAVSCISARSNRNLLSRSEQISNLTSDDIDRRFSITNLRTGTKIDGASFAVNTIGCIANLGVQDYRGMIDETQACSYSGWDDVKIALVPAVRKGGLERRFAIWGLYLGLCYMVDEGFTSMVFSLFWEKNLVGTIFVTQTGSPLTEQFGASLNGTLIDQIQNATIMDAMSDDAQSDIDVNIFFVPHGQLFEPIAAAAVLAKLMVSAAKENNELRIRDSITTKRGYLEWITVESVLPLRGPPLMFTYGRILDAALKVTKWMAHNAKNRELIAEVNVNGNTIGKLHGSSHAANSVETS